MISEKGIKHTPEVFGFKEGCEEFPKMIVVSVSYVCNARCSHCPYTNSQIRRQYHKFKFIQPDLFKKISDEAGEYGAYIRLTGGGEPLLHPQILELIEYAKSKGARIGLITNGSLLTPSTSNRLLSAETDMIEVSADAGDAETYAMIRVGLDFDKLVRNVRHLVKERNRRKSKSRVIASVVNQKAVRDKLDEIVEFWANIVDDVQVRKFLTWNILNSSESGDPEPYLGERVPCPWPFERLNIDTRGVVGFCGFDIKWESNFGNVYKRSIKSIWNGRKFNQWRKLILEGKYEEIPICRVCPDWRYRSWEYNYYLVVKKAELIRKTRMNE